jgi:hypothetical protein
MRFFLFFLLVVVNLNAQSWQSISKIGTFETAPYRQFSIDPYRNNIWFVHDTKVSVIENSGAIHVFTSAELGLLFPSDELCFGFTPNNTYFSKSMEGLYTFNNGVRNLVFSSTEINSITTNYDTVYTMSGSQNMFKYTSSSTIDAMYGLANLKAKNEFMYFNVGVIGRKIGLNTVYLHTDPQYLVATINDFKFSRKSDTLYVAGKKGISYAYNYDFLDTITPNNTINMPSPNVLEIEFDHNDSLWAVFGDVNDTPFALAKLEGNAWTNRFDNSNSPIDFSNFYGLEIDTLGNLWVADLNYLHTLLTPNSPAWLGLNENGKTNQFKLFPNPATKTIHLEGISEEDQVIIFDFQGNKCPIQRNGNNLNIESLPRGLYLIFVNTKYGYFCHRLIKQ